YKRVSTVQTKEEEEDIILELQDRFGKIPEQLSVLLASLELRRISSLLGVHKISVNVKNIVIEWKEGQNIVEPQYIMEWIQSNKEYLTIMPPSRVEYRMPKDIVHGLRLCSEKMKELYSMIDKE
ncbi:MAG: hypothetical protein K2M30_01255, partial [Desulfovibrionaceae bacterium]|nr:hypothetical protein [Desulfovibrionaceae bacterium]